ncbi:hypothetical protein M2451_002399 [Dysgonomonas sp. PFB1-18]|uniref:GldM family protein n=1 Tax=unclassified Dysgonomonas TaxID=2630389 RepID=UPI002475EAB4|nr:MULTISPECIES: GldM family protein [unclassified Dysgonomonas]MDL2302919.1 hypothetical protein [Dysgonomonas sp. OttesenSCG-928-D17]MDH6307165.1 hypothetical protein [Dysgonomonas sp. PF1-14]MDH6337084.1 hypothetical protein [Dysgonomonas sp. PF1-16]MDH6381070.1 hypothetical protein [Dysgonomonas sp. PFB1-18]MDH6396351.1 hypothetical protein [Dysgonomonas sp. PF1-23]
MKHISLLCLIAICLCLCRGQASAQCDNTLVDKAVMQSGANAVYLREFKVKFDGLEKGKIPSAKYPVLLSKNTTYRFNVCDAEGFDGEVILELYLKDKLVGSTFETKTSSNLQHFDYTCSKAATYEVVMSFRDGKAGCAAGVLSMVSEKDIQPEDGELDILYANADNPIIIYDDKDEFAEIDVAIDNGNITKADGINYIIHPQETGTALLTIRVLNRNGTLREFKQKRFAVLKLDKPYATLRGVKGNTISKSDLINSGRIDLWFSEDMRCNYRVVSFTLSDRDDLISGMSSTSSKFSKSQREWIKDQPSGTQLYIKNIRVKTSENTVMDIPSFDFEIE